jgi:hypothetical protein
LTRDRRGFENTFLLHADQPGEKPRLLYWYRTAPGVALGRAPLDEEAIRTIEDQHPNIDFDWPAILALGEVMIHEEEAAPRPQKQQQRQKDRRRDGPREQRPQPQTEVAESAPVEDVGETLDEPPEPLDPLETIEDVKAPEPELPAPHQSTHGLLDELVGREIATRLRARHSEIVARIHQKDAEPAAREEWLRQAEALDPDLWVTPDQILKGVSGADSLFDRLRQLLNS